MRYERQITLKEWGAGAQEKLARSRVVVIGAGGLGCPALQYLCAAGVGTLGIVDGDRVSLPDLHRQILFGEGAISGRVKPLRPQRRSGENKTRGSNVTRTR